ncbi:hypothetical protein [Chthoniobacter sp.]
MNARLFPILLLSALTAWGADNTPWKWQDALCPIPASIWMPRGSCA